VFVSDRTMIRSIRLAKANAFMSNLNQVTPETLTVLKDAFWTKIADIKKVRMIVYSKANPIEGEIEEIWYNIEDSYNKYLAEMRQNKESETRDLNQMEQKSFEMVVKLKQAHQKIVQKVNDLNKMNLTSTKAQQYLDQINAFLSAEYGGNNVT
jgi:hypothetical protein